MERLDDADEIGKCPWCGATGEGFADSPMPSDHCGHDPALTGPCGVDVPAPAWDEAAHHSQVCRSVNLSLPVGDRACVCAAGVAIPLKDQERG